MNNEPRAPFPGTCRYCGQPRPCGYQITCGRSECQEAAFHDKERRPAPRKRAGRS